MPNPEELNSAVEKQPVAAVAAGDVQLAATRRNTTSQVKKSLRDPSGTGKGKDYFADELEDAEDSDFGKEASR